MKARHLACAAVGLACLVPVAAEAQYTAYMPAVSQDQIAVNVRAAGFAPLSRPALRGAVYYLRAMSRGNVEMRVAVDARSGRVLSATRVSDTQRAAAQSPVPEAPPRYEPRVRGSGYSEAVPLPPGRRAGREPAGTGRAASPHRRRRRRNSPPAPRAPRPMLLRLPPPAPLRRRPPALLQRARRRQRRRQPLRPANRRRPPRRLLPPALRQPRSRERCRRLNRQSRRRRRMQICGPRSRRRRQSRPPSPWCRSHRSNRREKKRPGEPGRFEFS